MQNIPLSIIKEIPFIDTNQLAGRFLPTLHFYDSDNWHIWIPAGEHLIKINGHPVEGIYFSKYPEKQSDLYLEFINFLFQKASIDTIEKPINGIENDIFNIASSLTKFEVLFEYSKNGNKSVSRMVITEIEYLFGVCRSIFDLLQEIISALWDTVKLFDKTMPKKKLPNKFSKMVIDNEKVMDVVKIEKKYHLPKDLAQFYYRHSGFFYLLRKYRNNIEHHGSSLDYIFITDRGFAVKDTTKPFSLFNIWNDEHKLQNGLSSLRPAIAYIIKETLNSCEDFAKSIQNIIKFSPNIVPDFKIFMRSHSIHELLKIDEIISKCLWWDK